MKGLESFASLIVCECTVLSNRVKLSSHLEVWEVATSDKIAVSDSIEKM